MQIKKFIAGSVATGLMLASLAMPAFAHTTQDQAADTPLASEQALDNALDNYLGAVENSSGGAANALVRNPTCGAHNGPDGIHPPGNP